eukprot:1159201-Pelagomonas_calceolata.AAC.4
MVSHHTLCRIGCIAGNASPRYPSSPCWPSLLLVRPCNLGWASSKGAAQGRLITQLSIQILGAHRVNVSQRSLFWVNGIAGGTSPHCLSSPCWPNPPWASPYSLGS